MEGGLKVDHSINNRTFMRTVPVNSQGSKSKWNEFKREYKVHRGVGKYAQLFPKAGYGAQKVCLFGWEVL